MLRLTRWIADYYLCDWAAVLDAVVPAGVRGGGTRMATLLSVDAEAAQRLSRTEASPTKTCLEVPEGSGRRQGTDGAGGTGPGRSLHASPHRRAAAKA